MRSRSSAQGPRTANAARSSVIRLARRNAAHRARLKTGHRPPWRNGRPAPRRAGTSVRTAPSPERAARRRRQERLGAPRPPDGRGRPRTPPTGPAAGPLDPSFSGVCWPAWRPRRHPRSCRAARAWSTSSCGPWHRRSTGPGGDGPRPSAGVLRGNGRRPRLRRCGDADRGRPVHQPAVHRREDDRAPRAGARPTGPRDRDRLRLPGGDPGRDGLPGPVARADPRAGRDRDRRSCATSATTRRSRCASPTAASETPTGLRGRGSSSRRRHRTSRPPCAISWTRRRAGSSCRSGSRGRQELTLVIRHDDTWTERGEGACVFVPLVGAAGFATG